MTEKATTSGRHLLALRESEVIGAGALVTAKALRRWRRMKSQPISSLLHHAFGIKGYHHIATHCEDGEIVFEFAPERPPKEVEGESWVRHVYRWRKVLSLSIGLKSVWSVVAIAPP
jgi:hypothetical protein